MPGARDSSNVDGEDASRDPRVRRWLRRYEFRFVQRALGPRPAVALYAFINGTLSIAILAAVAHVADAPLVFPSLGPTAFLLFIRPRSRDASPRNTVLGHLIGVAAGWGSLAAFGLLGAPDVLEAGVTWARVGAAALSLGATSGAMVLLRASHPPAGATTLIVSLGLMTQFLDLTVLMLAVVGLIGQAMAINGLAGVRYPWWRAQEEDAET